MSAKLMHVVGARPNFVKLAPVIAALADEAGLEQLVVHTGQHYDARMSGDILADLQFPTPDVYLGIGSGTHAEQTGRTMIAFERVLLEERPELVIVAGERGMLGSRRLLAEMLVMTAIAAASIAASIAIA